MNIILNDQNIVKIEIVEKRENKRVYFLTEKRWFGLKTRTSGFYSPYGFSAHNPTELPEDCYCEDGKVFFYPYIKITYTNGVIDNFWSKDKVAFEDKVKELQYALPNQIKFISPWQ